MGQFDHNNYVIEVKFKDDLTDSRYDDILAKGSFSLKEFKEYEKQFSKLMFNHTAEKIIRFFVDYKSGAILPDRFDDGEPVRKPFNKDDISIPVSYVSCPGGGVDLLKKRRYSASIENKTFAIFFEETPNGFMYLKPTAPPREYNIIRFFFSIHKNTDIHFIVDLMRDLKSYLNADYGKVYIQSTNETIAE